MNADIGLLFFIIIVVVFLVTGLITYFIERPDLRITQSKVNKINNSKTTERENQKVGIAETTVKQKNGEVRSEMENEQEKMKQSGCGKASFILGCICCSYYLLILVLAIIEMCTPTPEGIDGLFKGFHILVLLFYGQFPILILSVPGLILGIIGLNQKYKRKYLAIWGIGMNILVVIPCIVMLLMMMGL